MKHVLAFLAFTVAAFAASAPVVTVDLYGNVFLNGENTNQQLADFARGNPDLAPQVDGAVRDLVLAARARIAADVKVAQDAAAAQIAAKDTEKAAAISAVESARDSALAAKDAELATLRARVAALETELAAEKAKATPNSSP